MIYSCILKKISTVYLDDSFAHFYHYFNQLYEVVTQNASQLTVCLVKNSLLEFLAFETTSVALYHGSVDIQ